MFNPGQVRSWRTEVADNPYLRIVFQDYCLGEENVTVPDAPSTSQFPRQIGHMTTPAAIFGSPFDAKCLDGIGQAPIYSETPKHEVFANARVIGANGLLTEDRRLLVGQDARDLGRKRLLQRLANGYFGFLYEETSDGIVVRFATREQPRFFSLRAMYFPHLEGGNFGSFMFRQLPQMLAAAPFKGEADCYITPGRMPWFEAALDLLGFPTKPIYTVNEVCGDVFQSVMTFGTFDCEGFLDCDTRDRIAALVQTSTSRSIEPRKKLYVSRALSGLSRPNYRPMLNELLVEKRMQDCDFAIVYPETLSLKEQICTFSAATHIVGPSGSGMFNVMFSPPGAKIVDIETFHVTVRQHARLYSSLNHEYAFAFAPFIVGDEREPVHRRWTLPDPLLNTLLEWTLAA